MTASGSQTGTTPRQRSTADIIATIVAFVLAVAVGVLSLSFSPLFVMATDPCSNNNCDTTALTWAYVVAWGGLAVAAIVAIGGTVFAAIRQRVMWVWPAAGLALIAVTFIIGTLLAGSVTPNH
ncbi:hypothetical protein BN1232_01573 [Mycobacterium rhizamassiliense]|jgi:hypothetical protein|uniref:Transmembrane protein n=1 Tax=Mycobacterium rhizamassiliense TaxID=1841860 RepID=A0A2U3NLR1_9MYCO|nr:hypothetical protein [Mycobacterium rhizamassiliense]SPM32426.1 hypothetical protein BN1232_01573 [Mycobacterium rhizamassiliense]